MKSAKLVKILKVLLLIEDINVIKYTLESLIEELGDGEVHNSDPDDSLGDPDD